MFSTRAEWRKLKDAHGIPDGVCNFSMGERIESWHKKIAATNDYKAKLVAIDGLMKDYKTYEAALKTTKASKFKGKTPAEQAKNLKDTQTAVHSEITSLENFRSGNEERAFPLVALKKNLQVAKAKLGSIPKTDLQALKDFYSVEYRNTCGKWVKMALTQNPTGKLKTALESWEAAGHQIDHMVDNTADDDLPHIAQIYAACKMGVEGLALEIL